MNYDVETFTCEDCQNVFAARRLAHRDTMPGQYCKTCGSLEKCACCGELNPAGSMQWKEDGRNFICSECEAEYEEVREFIATKMIM